LEVQVSEAREVAEIFQELKDLENSQKLTPDSGFCTETTTTQLETRVEHSAHDNKDVLGTSSTEESSELFLSLAPEIIQHIASYLNPVSTAIFTFTSKPFKSALGILSWGVFNLPRFPNNGAYHGERFLELLAKDMHDHEFCKYCLIIHIRPDHTILETWPITCSLAWEAWEPAGARSAEFRSSLRSALSLHKQGLDYKTELKALCSYKSKPSGLLVRHIDGKAHDITHSQKTSAGIVFGHVIFFVGNILSPTNNG
jgi:hypothetical protein